MKTNTSKIWPYVLAGSAVGGTLGYLFMTQSGKKVRDAVSHPEQLNENLDEARIFLEKKAKGVTDRLRTVLDKAKQGMEAGQHAYQEAEESYRSHMRKLEGKNNEIASTVHKSVDNLSKTAYTVEQTILDPLYEVGAFYRGFQRCIRTFLGKQGQVAPFRQSGSGY